MGVDGVSAKATFSAVPMTFRVCVSCAELTSIRQDYDNDRGRSNDLSEAGCAIFSGGFDFDAHFDKDPLWSKVVDAKGVTNESLLATSPLVSTVAREVPVCKTKYGELRRSVTDEVQ